MKNAYLKSKTVLLVGVSLTIALSALMAINTHTAHADELGKVTRVASAITAGGGSGTVEGHDGSLWFGNGKGKIAKTTKAGVVTSYSIPFNTFFHINDLARSPDNSIWFTYNDKMAKITPEGVITTIGIPSAYSGTASTVVAGPDGNMWTSGFASGTNGTYRTYIHAYTTSGEYLRTYQTPGIAKSLITNYADNTLWYMYQNSSTTNSTITIVKMNTDGSKTEYLIPTVTGSGYDLAFGTDGQIWFLVGTNNTAQRIGKVTSDGLFTFYPSTVVVNSIAAGMDGNMWITSAAENKILRVAPTGNITTYLSYIPGGSGPGSAPIGITAGSDGNMWYLETQGSKVSKIGTGTTSTETDVDEDGLNIGLELTQGTSDFNADSDLDGLSDLVESASFASRDLLFCNSVTYYCEYPSPMQRDLYVEMDWMSKPSNSGYSTDSYSMQPSSAQINSLKSAYQSKGIRAHFDTGQLGGGNEVTYQQVIKLSNTTNVPDFYDYKNGGDGVSRQFDENRYHTYRYLLLGYQYLNEDGQMNSSGASYAGDDDTFVSYGLIKDTFTFDSLDTAIASTAIHEIGHGLCLTNTNGGVPAYPGQPESCRYSGIDAYAGNSYQSAMNYSKQLYLVDYSSGTNGTTLDHNDWTAIRLQDFANHDAGGDSSAGVSNLNNKKTKKVKSKLIAGPTNSELKAARQKNR